MAEDAGGAIGAGSTLWPWRLGERIGRGGMGAVFRATSTAAGVESSGPIALKVVHPHLADSADFVARFRREAEIGICVRHPNVVRTLDAGEDRGLVYLVMEYVEGQTLRDLLEELGRVPEELCIHVAREVAKGLRAIHDAGAVHRDLKPENVLVAPDHAVKVMDLGVALLVDHATRLSRTGMFVGSLPYASPEQVRGGRSLDGRVDLHALGLVLFELSTAARPFPSDDAAAIVHAVLNEVPKRVGALNPQLSAFFEEVVRTLIEKEPDHRFASAGALLEVLAAGEESEWWIRRAAGVRAETRRPLRRVRVPRETSLLGRGEELAVLRRAFVRAAEGNGQVVLLEGEAGIGKTRLVDELVATLRAGGTSSTTTSGRRCSTRSSSSPSGRATTGCWPRPSRRGRGSGNATSRRRVASRWSSRSTGSAPRNQAGPRPG